MIQELWGAIDEEILGCLEHGGPIAVEEVAAKLGMSENAAASLLCLLAQQGKVRICIVATAGRADASAAGGVDRAA